MLKKILGSDWNKLRAERLAGSWRHRLRISWYIKVRATGSVARTSPVKREREVVPDSDHTATLFAGRGTPAPLLEFAQACLVS